MHWATAGKGAAARAACCGIAADGRLCGFRASCGLPRQRRSACRLVRPVYRFWMLRTLPTSASRLMLQQQLVYEAL